MKKISLVRWITILLVTVLIFGNATVPAAAKTDSSSAASSLAVYLTVNGKTELIHDYTIGEMEGLIDGRNVKYSSIDSMPARVLTVANGVYMSTLLSDLSKYTKLDVNSFTKLELTGTDDWSRPYTNSSLFKTRYYYEDLFTTDTWNKFKGTVDSSASSNSVEVAPMLAVDSWQGRLDGGAAEASINMNRNELFRFCIGMDAKDLTSGQSTTSEYGRWINKIEITLPDVEVSTKATGLTIDKEGLSIEKGKSAQITGQIVPSDATNKEITWSSENTSIATVSTNGTVTGVASGTTKIKAVSGENSSIYKTCLVTVSETSAPIADTKIAVTGISLNQSKATVAIEKSTKLTATVSPGNASNTKVTWTSSDATIATVDEKGNVTGKKVGTTTITAKTEDGGKTATCTVTVTNSEIKVTGIQLDEKSLALKLKESKKLKATISPENATNKNISWSTNTSGVATVDNSGTITAKGTGSAIITATTEDGKYTATCTVSVTEESTKWSNSFSDVNEKDWYYNAVALVNSKNLFQGTTQTTFGPSEKMTRGMFVTVLGRLSGIDSAATAKKFDDVATSQYFAGYVAWASDNGIVTGYGNNSFGPNNTVTREQMALMVFRYAKNKGYDVSNVNQNTFKSFSDCSNTMAVAQEAMAWAINNKIIKGSDGKLNPKGEATRAEVAQIIMNFTNLQLVK